MQFSTALAQHQFGTLLFPGSLFDPLLEIARGLDGIVVPLPTRPRVDFELDKVVFRVHRFEIEGERALIERWVVGGTGQSWAALLFARLFPVFEMGEVGSDFPNRILDERAPIAKRHLGKLLAKIPASPGMGMISRFDRGGLRPG